MKYNRSSTWMASIDTTNVLFIVVFASGVGATLFEEGIIGNVLLHLFYFGFGLVLAVMQILRLDRWMFILYYIIIWTSTTEILLYVLGCEVGLSWGPMLFVSAGLALIVVRGALAPNVARFACYLVLGYFFLMMLSGVNPNTIVPDTSHNIVSAYVVAATMLLVALYRNGQINPPVITAFLSMILSVWAIGRSGIISSFIIFSSIFFVSNIKSRLPKFKHVGIIGIILKISILVLLFAVVFYMSAVDDYFFKFKQQGFESIQREWILRDYFDSITLMSAFSGVELARIPSIAAANFNPHNTFIQLHSFYGFFSIIIVFVILLNVLKEFLSGHRVFAICSMAYCFRIFTDSQFTPLNIFVLLILFFYGARTEKRDIDSKV